MLIKLHPESPNPTVLFELTFHDLSPDLPTPPAWLEHLNMLSVDDLALPDLLHSLDKSSCLPCLVTEVVFDVPSLTIHCSFVDGTVEEWPLVESSCLRILDSVTQDVNESAIEVEREKERAQQRDNFRKEAQPPTMLNSPPITPKSVRHKKQRSLLMSLVATISMGLTSSSLVRLTSRASKSSPSLPSTPPPSPASSMFLPTASIASSSGLNHRLLRRRARSTLVEAFRSHVQRELVARMPSGGYYTWIARSQLRSVSDRLDELVRHASLRPADFRDTSHTQRPTQRVPSNPSSLDEDGGLDTDTDGSSVHTPSSQHNLLGGGFYFAHTPADINDRDGFDTPHNFTPKEAAEYQHLSNVSMRLRHLLVLARAREIHAENETRQRDSILEVRSRRRAWLNGALVRGSHSNSDVGFSMPCHRSRLGLVSWSGEDYVYDPDEPVVMSRVEEPSEEYGGYEERLVFGPRKGRGRPNARLFPVTEESEDEESLLDMREFEIEFPPRTEFLDLECDPEDTSGSAHLIAALDISPPPRRPRPRTRSMLGLNELDSPQSSLLASSILCRPFVPPKDQPPHCHSVEDAIDASSLPPYTSESSLPLDIQDHVMFDSDYKMQSRAIPPLIVNF